MEIPKEVAPQPSPDPEAVKQFIKDNSNKKEAREVKLDLDPADLAPASKHTPKKQVDTPLDPTFTSDTPNANSQDPWVFTSPDEASVSVEQEEKDIFFKAVLNDDPVVMDIKVSLGPNPIPVRCRSLSNFEIDVIYAAIDKDRSAGNIVSTAQFMTMLQRYSIMLQVSSFNTKSLNAVSVTGLEIPEAVEELQSKYNALVQGVDQARWQVILTALRLFSIKLKICNDNILNENFWCPADTD